jgi:hypothetical protein
MKSSAKSALGLFTSRYDISGYIRMGFSFIIQTMSCNGKVNLQLFMILYRDNFLCAATDIKEQLEVSNSCNLLVGQDRVRRSQAILYSSGG